MRLLLRRDPFRRFYSCLVFVPREKYNTQVRQRIERVIGEAFSAISMESQVQIARIEPRAHPHRRAHPAERSGRASTPTSWSGASPLAVRSWADDFKTALLARFDEAYALQLFATVCAGVSRRLYRGFSGRRRRARRHFPGSGGEGAAATAPRHLSGRSAPQGSIFPEDLPRSRMPSRSRTCCPCSRTWGSR